MSIDEIAKNIQIVTDAEGNPQAVQVQIAQWQNIMELLEDMQDAIELTEARQEKEELIPWEQVKAEYLAENPKDDI